MSGRTLDQIKNFKTWGEFFNYPQCCIDTFISDDFDKEYDRRESLFWGSGYVPCKACHEKSKNLSIEQASKLLLNRNPFEYSNIEKILLPKIKSLELECRSSIIFLLRASHTLGTLSDMLTESFQKIASKNKKYYNYEGYFNDVVYVLSHVKSHAIELNGKNVLDFEFSEIKDVFQNSDFNIELKGS